MLKIVKDSVLRVSRSFGYDIVPLREMRERDFALHLRELLIQQRIDCVLDVGANVGQYHDFLRDRVLYDGLIVSFEPVARHVALLRERSRSDSKWHVEGYALGSHDGTLPINVMASDQFSSFLEPDNTRVRDYATLNVPSAQETVTVRTLDVVLPVHQRAKAATARRRSVHNRCSTGVSEVRLMRPLAPAGMEWARARCSVSGTTKHRDGLRSSVIAYSIRCWSHSCA